MKPSVGFEDDSGAVGSSKFQISDMVDCCSWVFVSTFGRLRRPCGIALMFWWLLVVSPTVTSCMRGGNGDDGYATLGE